MTFINNTKFERLAQGANGGRMAQEDDPIQFRARKFNWFKEFARAPGGLTFGKKRKEDKYWVVLVQ